MQFGARVVVAGLPHQVNTVPRMLGKGRDNVIEVLDQADHPHHRGRVDSLTVIFVVQGNVPGDDRGIKDPAGICHPLDGLVQLPEDFRVVRVTVVKAVSNRQWFGPAGDDIADRFN